MAYGGEVDATSVRRMGLEFANGSQIEALPGSPNTVQGFTADLIIIDEAGIIVDELYTVMRPSLAVTGGELVMASKAYQARGAFYKEWTEGEGWYREEVRADDPVECPRITDAFLSEERQHMMAHEYAREYLCRFDETGTSSVFGPKWMFERATNNDIPPLWDEEGQYLPYEPGAAVTEDEDVASLERRLEEVQRQLDEHRRAGRRVERESDDDLVWSWGEWQQ
jgi:phage FluMu gp28-like protein